MSRPLPIFPLFLILSLLAFSGCPSSSDAPADGDGDASNVGEPCNSSLDCDPPKICVEGRCELPGGDMVYPNCLSNYHCPAGERCNTDEGQCEPIRPDVDESSDGDLDEETEADGDAEEFETDGDESDAEEESDGDDDGDGPVLTVEFLSPLDEEVVDGAVTISVTASAGSATVDKVEIYSGDDLLAEPTAYPYETQWDTASLPEGHVSLRAVAVRGEARTDRRIDVTVDHSDPTVSITAPEDESRVCFGDPLSVELDAGDNLRQIEVYVDDQLRLTTEETSFDLDVSALSQGDHGLRVVVADAVESHQTAEASLSFKVDDGDPQILLKNVTWTGEEEGYLTGEVDAETLFELDVSDCSGLSVATLTVEDSYNHVTFQTSDVADFPVTRRYDELLYVNDKQYPAVLYVVANGTDPYGNFAFRNFKITVRRLNWTYDSGMTDIPEGYRQTGGAAAGTIDGNLYVPMYDQLQSLTPEGVFRWACDVSEAGDSFVTTPVVAEAEGLDPVAVGVTAWGHLIMAVDAPDGPFCAAFRPEGGLSNPTAPAVGALTGDENGFHVPFYYCAQIGENSRCYRIDYTGTFTPDRRAFEPAFNVVWTKTFPDIHPPRTPVVPTGDAFRKLTVTVGRHLHQIDRDSGNFGANDQINPGEIIFHIDPNPVGDGLFITSEKEFRIFKYDLVERTDSAIVFPEGSVPKFLNSHVVSDGQGTFLVATKQERNYVAKGVLMAYRLQNFGRGENIWEFQVGGLFGGSPAIGPGDIVYATGSNAEGWLWAVNLYEGIEAGEPHLNWRMRFDAPFLAPALISPAGDLILIDDLNHRVHSIGIRKGAEFPAAAWPMAGGSPTRSSHYEP